MPSQKECTELNDRMMLSQARRNARDDHEWRIAWADNNKKVRAERKQLRQAAMVRVLDAVLIGVSLGALLVMCCVALAMA